jgi:hypothetical protein
LIALISRIVRGKRSPHRSMRRVYAALSVLLCLLVIPATAGASGRSVVRDCTDNGQIDSHHSQGDYKSALGSLPSDVDEYTDCRQIIEQAKRRDASSNSGSGAAGGSGGSGGGFSGGGGGLSGFDSATPPPASNIPASPAESGAVAKAAAGGGAPVAVAGEPITPGGTGITEAAFRHDVPGPLLVLVVLFGLGALAMTVSGGRARGLRAPRGAVRLFDRVFPHRA